jgi:basic membrane lipoprotein Med (substrate-binding protein (PBP1-ABC) superfamily)
MVESIINDEFVAEAYWGGMETGLVSLYELTSDVPTETASLISDRTEEIISGSYDPPIVEEEFIDNVIGTVNP